MTNKMDEMILVAKRQDVMPQEQHFEGVLSAKDNAEKVTQIVNALQSNLSVMRRGNAEENELYKQPIPYAVIKRGDEYFGYERLEGGGEARLHGKISLGVGGHMNDLSDGLSLNEVPFQQTLMTNLMRELNEEVSITKADGANVNMDIEIVGLINNDADKVGFVHLGVLLFIVIDDDADVSVLETDQLKGTWLTKSDLQDKEVYDRLEAWSKFVADLV